MGGFFRLLFLGPFWVAFLVAAAIATAGHYAQRAWQQDAELARELGRSAQPAAVAIEAFAGPQEPGLTEVNLRATLLFEYGVHLIYEGKSAREVYVVPIGPAEGGDGKTVLGALMLSPDQKAQFAPQLDPAADPAEGALHVLLPGMIAASRDKSDARAEMAGRGAVLGQNLVFVTPFLAPRDEAIARIVANRTTNPPAPFFNALAAVFALIGGAKFLLARRRRGRPARPTPAQNLLRTGSAQEARTAAELGYVPSGQKMFGKIPIPKLSRVAGLVVLVLSVGLWLRLKAAPELGTQQWAEIAVVLLAVGLIQFWPLIRARLTHPRRTPPQASPAQPIRMEPVRLSDFMAQRGGLGGSTAAVPPPLPKSPPPVPHAPQAHAPQAQAPVAQAAPAATGLVAQVLLLGSLVPAGVRLWVLLFVAAALGARLLPSEMRASYGTLISVALSLGMVGLFVWAYLSAIGRGLGAVFAAARSGTGRGAPPPEDPFDRLRRQRRG